MFDISNLKQILFCPLFTCNLFLDMLHNALCTYIFCVSKPKFGFSTRLGLKWLALPFTVDVRNAESFKIRTLWPQDLLEIVVRTQAGAG